MSRKGKWNSNFKKIPLLPDMTSWKDMKIQECGEKLISINEIYQDRIILESKYFLKGLEGSIKECFIRETVAELLIKASKLLPDNYKFVIWDAWRPIEVQRSIFNRYKEEMKHRNPDFEEEELISLGQKYVSFPSLDKDSPPPHSTGGALDLSIVDQSGNYLDMGTSFDDFSERARTRYFEERIEKGEKLSDNELIILNNRRLLFYTLAEEGFTNYPEEWWHYDYGNQFWAKTKGINAIYGIVTLNDVNLKI